ncbi:MAG: PadR family transcriptional regulator [Ktedonobacterales bacterium]
MTSTHTRRSERDRRLEGDMSKVGVEGAQARELPTSSYVILGLLATCGPQTPYEMKKLVDGSIGYFWDFPRAQLYVDPERLARLGLLAEQREAEGRRRRTYSITAQGAETLRRWLHEPATREVELRDTGLLKLYFGGLLDQSDIVALARREAELHRHRLATYEAIAAELKGDPTLAFALATVHMGLSYERLSLTYWDDIAAHPPTVAPEEG